MAFEQRDNSGSLFSNDRKSSDNHPTHKGACMIGGVEYWIAAWVKTSKDGNKRFFSLSFEPKERQDTQFGPEQTTASTPRTAQEPQEGTRQAAAGSGHQYDDSIPF
jgi:hypothetical protein